MRFCRPRWVDCLMFLLLMSGPPQLRVRDATASLRGEMDGATLLRLGVWAAGALWLFLRLYPFLVERGIVPRFRAPQIAGGMLLAVLAAGISVAPGPMLTAFSVYQLAVMMLFSWIFVQLYGPEVYVRYLFWGYLLLAIAIVFAWVLVPDMVVRRGRVRGDLIAPGGAVGALGLTLAFSGAVKLRRVIFVASVGLFLLVLGAAQTRTAFAAFLGALMLGWAFRFSGPIKKVLPIAVVLLLAGGIFDKLSTGEQFAVRNESSVMTLSDRVPLWTHLLSTMLRESPVIGLGYFSASRVLGPEYNPGLGNAHSAFVEVLVGGGITSGILLFALYCILVFRAAQLLAYGRRHPLVFAVLGLFAISFVMSTTITDGIQGGPVGFTFWSVTALLPVVWEQVRSKRSPPRLLPYAPLTGT